MTIRTGVVIASTGGTKLTRTLRSLRRMEPDLAPHVVLDVSSNTWRQDPHCNIPNDVPLLRIENRAHINGTLNAAMAWMATQGFSHAALFHDDLVFSPLPQHRGSLSRWFDIPQVASGSGISFGHFETFTGDTDGRRSPAQWDLESLEDDALWRFLAALPDPPPGGVDFYPPDRTFWFRAEGADKVRKWNRLGPTGCIVPVATWEALGRFDEHDGIFYDQEYPSECFRRKLPPIYAVPNFPYIHLHNQSMNPWGDPASGLFGNTGAAYERRFGARDNRACGWAGFWGDNWEAEWKD
jgi:hypothetical protein